MALVLSRTIDASPDRVFAVLSDLRQSREWMPAIQAIDQTTSGAFGLGTTWRETRRAGKRTMESTIRVTAYDPPSALDLAVEAKQMAGRMHFSLSPEGAGTRVRYEAVMRGRGFFRLMSGTMNRMMAQADADLLERLERQVAGKR